MRLQSGLAVSPLSSDFAQRPSADYGARVIPPRRPCRSFLVELPHRTRLQDLGCPSNAAFAPQAWENIVPRNGNRCALRECRVPPSQRHKPKAKPQRPPGRWTRTPVKLVSLIPHKKLRQRRAFWNPPLFEIGTEKIGSMRAWPPQGSPAPVLPKSAEPTPEANFAGGGGLALWEASGETIVRGKPARWVARSNARNQR